MSSVAPQSLLFQPIRLGDVELNHRVVLPPLTRFRADKFHVPLDMTVEYYKQRASVPGTLLIAEAAIVAPEAGGIAHMPGIYNDKQIEAWRKVRFVTLRFEHAPSDCEHQGDGRCPWEGVAHLPANRGDGPRRSGFGAP